MRVVFFNYGTRGDAQPQVALAAELEAHGIKARVAAPENLRAFVEKAGVEYAPLFGNSQEIMESEAGQRWLRSGDVRALMKEAGNIAARIDPDVFRTGLDAVHDADAIVGGTLAEDMAYTLAEHKKVPFLFGHTVPLETTGEYPSPFVATKPLPFAFLNRATHALFRKLAFGIHGKSLPAFRKQLGLPKVTSTVVSRAAALNVPALQFWSEHLVPHPKDASPKVVTTGFLRLPQAVRARMGEAAPPDALLKWLAAGPAPVYIGFGSMPMPALTDFVQDALAIGKQLNLRVAFSVGWNDVEPVKHLESDQLHFIAPVDHGWLFPQCAAVVHHGGAGTTAASVEAGVPSVISSFFADQPFWGARVERLGAGKHLPFRKLNRLTLGKAIQCVLTDEVRQRAKALGQSLRADDGNAKAVNELLRILQHSTPQSVSASARAAR